MLLLGISRGTVKVKGDYAQDILFSHLKHPSGAQGNLQVKRPLNCTDVWTPPPLVVAPSRIPCKSSWGHRVCLLFIENETTQNYQLANTGISKLSGVSRNTDSHFAHQDIQIWLQKLNKISEQVLVPNFLPKSFSNMANLATKLPFLSLISVP